MFYMLLKNIRRLLSTTTNSTQSYIYFNKSYKISSLTSYHKQLTHHHKIHWSFSIISNDGPLIYCHSKRWVSLSNTPFKPGLHIQKLSQLLSSDIQSSPRYKQNELIGLTRKIEERVLNFSTFQLYQILTLFSRHKSCPDSTLETLLMEIIDRLNKNEESLSNLQLSHLPLILSNIDLNRNQKEIVKIFLMQYTKIISKYLTSPSEDNDSLAGYKDQNFTEQELAFLSLGYSNIGYRNHTLFYDIAEYFIRYTRSKVGLVTEAPYINSNNLVNLFLSFSTMGITHPVFYQELTSKLSGTMNRFSASQITNIGIALATLSIDIEFPLFLSFLKDFEIAIKRLRFVFTPEDAIIMSWVICCLEIYKSLPDILIDLVKNFAANILFNKSQDKEVLNQIKQVLLTLELDQSGASNQIKEELRKQDTWDYLQQIEYKPEKPLDATISEPKVITILKVSKNLHKLFRALCHITNLPDNTPYEINLKFDETIQDFYFTPLLIEFINPNLKSETLNNSLFRIFISDNSNDSDHPLDPYESLKKKHLNMLNFIYVSISMESLPVVNPEDLVNLVIKKISEAFFQQFLL